MVDFFSCIWIWFKHNSPHIVIEKYILTVNGLQVQYMYIYLHTVWFLYGLVAYNLCTYMKASTHKLYHLCYHRKVLLYNLFIEFYVYEYGIVLKLISFYKNSLYGLIDMLLNAMFGNFETMYCYIRCRRSFLDISTGSKNLSKSLIIIFPHSLS